jgi:hypothetical protein
MSPTATTSGRPVVRRPRTVAKVRKVAVTPEPADAPELIPDGAAWREFVGRWLAAAGCTLGNAARGDWEVTLSPALQKRWRRQRVRLVFDPQRPTLPRGAWFTAPGSGAGRKILMRRAPSRCSRAAPRSPRCRGRRRRGSRPCARCAGWRGDRRASGRCVTSGASRSIWW